MVVQQIEVNSIYLYLFTENVYAFFYILQMLLNLCFVRGYLLMIILWNFCCDLFWIWFQHFGFFFLIIGELFYYVFNQPSKHIKEHFLIQFTLINPVFFQPKNLTGTFPLLRYQRFNLLFFIYSNSPTQLKHLLKIKTIYYSMDN